MTGGIADGLRVLDVMGLRQRQNLPLAPLVQRAGGLTGNPYPWISRDDMAIVLHLTLSK